MFAIEVNVRELNEYFTENAELFFITILLLDRLPRPPISIFFSLSFN